MLKEIYLDVNAGEKIGIVGVNGSEKSTLMKIIMGLEYADSSEPRKYCNWLKNKLKKEENFETSSITRQLKLKAQDGKYRMTDVVDIEGMFRIIESVPSKNALNYEYVDEKEIEMK